MKRRKSNTGTCPICGDRAKLTRHHILPQCHFGGRGAIAKICECCHRKVEVYLQNREGVLNGMRSKRSPSWYQMIFFNFVSQFQKEKTPIV